ncbi:hypothetical protein Sjap_023148 [Stephania japonica]|uniref:Uncharacterized protein n=1 Tax=Stephania japonica TaxID=461633 RepID=A0AAP0HMP1_9MAGN
MTIDVITISIREDQLSSSSTTGGDCVKGWNIIIPPNELVQPRVMIMSPLLVWGDYGGHRGPRGHVRVNEVGASTGPSHGASGPVIGQCSFFSCVEGAQPMPLFCRWVSDFSSVSPPRSPPNSKELSSSSSSSSSSCTTGRRIRFFMPLLLLFLRTLLGALLIGR